MKTYSVIVNETVTYAVELEAKTYWENIRTRQELIGNNLMEVIDDYPDQLRVVIDELVSHLNDNQLDQIEDLIVNNYSEDN